MSRKIESSRTGHAEAAQDHAFGALLEATLEAAEGHLVLLDERGIVVGASSDWAAFAASTGLFGPGCDAPGHDYHAALLAAPPSRKLAARRLAQALEKRARQSGPAIDIEMRSLGEDRVRWVHVRVHRIVLNRKVHLLALHRDTTGDRQTAAALRRSEGRYRSLVEHQQDLVCRYLDDGTIVFFNSACEESFGRRPEELVGRGLRSVLPAEAVEELIPTESGKDGGQRCVEFSLTLADGSERWINWRQARVVGPDRLGLELQGVGRDVTERRRHEKERKLLEQQLHQSQRLEALGRLAGGVAHDFNNLLTVILNASGLIRHRLGEGVKASQVGEDLTSIESAAEQASRLTGQLLSFSRGEVMAVREIQPSVVLGETRAMLERLMPGTVTLEMTDEAPDAWIHFDVSRLQQILLNLVVNSLAAMPEGGRLALSLRAVDSSGEDSGGWPREVPARALRLRVEDEGCGMDEAVRQRIFEPFYTTREPGQGSGLGLAMVHGLVTQGGGRVAVQSAPGAGTTFDVFLPLVPAPGSSPETPEEAPESKAGAPTILLAEDDAAVQRLTVLALERVGYRVITASTGKEALALAQEHREAIDLLVTDVVMPGLSGPKLVSALADAGITPPVLYVSGYTSNEIVSSHPEGGPAHVLCKPFRGRELVACVEDLVGRPAPANS